MKSLAIFANTKPPRNRKLAQHQNWRSGLYELLRCQGNSSARRTACNEEKSHDDRFFLGSYAAGVESRKTETRSNSGKKGAKAISVPSRAAATWADACWSRGLSRSP